MKYVSAAVLTLVIIFLFHFTVSANPPSQTVVDYGISGSLTTSGAIGVTNVQDYKSFGVQSNVKCSGACPAYTATLQGSEDGLTYFNLPIRATGDATKSGSLSASGSIFTEEDFLEVNFVRVFYGVPSGFLNIQEIRKARKNLP